MENRIGYHRFLIISMQQKLFFELSSYIFKMHICHLKKSNALWHLSDGATATDFLVNISLNPFVRKSSYSFVRSYNRMCPPSFVASMAISITVSMAKRKNTISVRVAGTCLRTNIRRSDILKMRHLNKNKLNALFIRWSNGYIFFQQTRIYPARFRPPLT